MINCKLYQNDQDQVNFDVEVVGKSEDVLIELMKGNQCNPEQPIQHGAGNIGGDPDAGVDGDHPHRQSRLVEHFLAVKEGNGNIEQGRRNWQDDLAPHV